MAEIKNAIITKGLIDDADRGLLTAWLMLDYGGASQGFGGYSLYSPAAPKKNDGNYAGVFIFRCMQIAGVSDWSAIAGKTCRARIENGLVTAIGHIVKDDWFCPSEVFQAMEARHG